MQCDDLSLIVVDELPPGSTIQTRWDELVAASPHSGFMQSSHWAAFKRKQGFGSVHLLLQREGDIIGGATGYSSNSSPRNGWLIVPDGPVLPWRDQELARRGLTKITDEIRNLAGKLNVIGVRIEPRLAPPVPSVLRSFRRAPFDVVPEQTMYLNLSNTEEHILSQMHHKARYNIGLAGRHGVRAIELDSMIGLQRFYEIMLEASGRDGFYLESLSHFYDLALSLPPGMLRLILSEHDGDCLAAVLMIVFGNRATYLYGGTSNKKRNLMAGYSAQWCAIKSAKQAGCDVYDFYGYVAPCMEDHPYAGFSKFKQKFNGQPVRFIGAHDFVFIDRLGAMVCSAFGELQCGN